MNNIINWDHFKAIGPDEEIGKLEMLLIEKNINSSDLNKIFKNLQPKNFTEQKKEVVTSLTIKETADFLGCSQSKIRIGLQRGLFTFGKAFASPSKTRKNFTTYSYYISKHQVEEYVGMTYEQFLERKGEN